MVILKFCKKCNEETERYPCRQRCKKCAALQSTAWWAAHPEKLKEKTRTYYEANQEKIRANSKAYRNANAEKIKTGIRAWADANPAKRTRLAKRKETRRLGLPECDLDEADCDRSRAEGTPCPVFPWLILSTGGGSHRPEYPEMDRIVPARGYVKTNIRFISAEANRRKSNASKREIAALYADSLTWPDD